MARSRKSLSKVPASKKVLVKSELARIAMLLRDLRQNQNMTIAEFAEAVGVTEETIGAIERLDRLPSVPMLISILDTFGLQLTFKKK